MDNPNKRGSPDNDLINMHQDYEVGYWTATLRVTREQLQQAVDTVGNSVRKVREYLGR